MAKSKSLEPEERMAKMKEMDEMKMKMKKYVEVLKDEALAKKFLTMKQNK